MALDKFRYSILVDLFDRIRAYDLAPAPPTTMLNPANNDRLANLAIPPPASRLLHETGQPIWAPDVDHVNDPLDVDSRP